MLPMSVARSSLDGVAIRCVLPVVWTTSYFHTVGLVDGRARICAVYRMAVPVVMAAGWARAAAAHWLGGQACWAEYH